MSLIDRLNRRIVARLHRAASQITVGRDALVIDGHDGTKRSVSFERLVRATIGHRDVYAADAIVLTLEFNDATCVEFFQDDLQWQKLTEALDLSGRTTVQSPIWQIQAIADGAGSPPRDLLARG